MKGCVRLRISLHVFEVHEFKIHLCKEKDTVSSAVGNEMTVSATDERTLLDPYWVTTLQFIERLHAVTQGLYWEKHGQETPDRSYINRYAHYIYIEIYAEGDVKEKQNLRKQVKLTWRIKDSPWLRIVLRVKKNYFFFTIISCWSRAPYLLLPTSLRHYCRRHYQLTYSRQLAAVFQILELLRYCDDRRCCPTVFTEKIDICIVFWHLRELRELD